MSKRPEREVTASPKGLKDKSEKKVKGLLDQRKWPVRGQ